MQSYGLTPTAITAVTDTGNPLTLQLSDVPGPSSSPMTRDEKTSRALYLLDHYGVSDEFYNEFSQVR